jgi:hypothetical protein
MYHIFFDYVHLEYRGLSGHKVGVYIYQKQSSGDTWHFCSKDWDYSKSEAWASVKGVWEYKSSHKVGHVGCGGLCEEFTVLTLTDW